MVATQAEPSTISYLYGPGMNDILKVIGKTKQQISGSVDAITSKSSAKIPVISPGLIGYLVAVPKIAVFFVYWLFSAATMMLASAFFCLFMLLPHVLVFTAVEIVGLLLVGATWLTDTLYLNIRRISNVCDNCHNRFRVPVYVCGNCGSKHMALLPGKYGILHHTCTCGEKLPSSVLVFKKPRRKLQALCPFCYKAGLDEEVLSSGSRTICIPVVGGASTGKSAFITAYASSVISKIAPSKGLTTRFYDGEREQMYNSMSDAYRDGVVEKTVTATAQNASSAFSFSFFVDGPSLKPSRMMQLLDIAGETFVDNNENERQSQYAHCEGIVLVIDPLAIPQVSALCANSLNSSDRGSISDARLEDVMSALQNDLRETADVDRSGRIRTPLAVVMNKVDASPILDRSIGDSAVRQLQSADHEAFGNALDATDYLCRQFLVDADMGDVVDIIGQQFVTSRFFAVSSIGHAAGIGAGFSPKNVDIVMDWILLNRDPLLAKSLGSPEFSKVKLPIKTPAVGLMDELFGNLQQRQVVG